MKRQYIEFGNNGWNLEIYYNVQPRDFEEIKIALYELGCSISVVRKTLQTIKHKNTGFTFTNSMLKTSMVCITAATSVDQFISTVVHEIKHVQSHICSYYNVPEKGEEAAYLIGYIAKRMYRVLRKVIKEYV